MHYKVQAIRLCIGEGGKTHKSVELCSDQTVPIFYSSGFPCDRISISGPADSLEELQLAGRFVLELKAEVPYERPKTESDAKPR